MNLLAVMAEVGSALAALDTPLKIYVGAPGTLVAPDRGAAVVIPYPTRVDYDGTYGRGMDTIEQLIVMLHPRPTDEATVTRVSGYTAGSGDLSVKQALESFAWSTCHGCRVEAAEFDAVEYAGVKYMAAMFTVAIWGSGA